MSVDELNRKIAETRLQFFAAKNQLEASLSALPASEHTVTRLVEEAECYGIAYAIDLLSKRPDHFDIKVTSKDARLAPLAPQVTALAEHSSSLDRLVAQREDILTARDPKHQRVYMLMGREFVIDAVPGGYTMRFTDERRSMPLHLEPVLPNMDAAPSRTKKRNLRKDYEL